MSALVLFIAPDDRLHGWWRVENGAVAERGDGNASLPDDLPNRVVVVAPAEAVTVHRAELGGLATQQARAAARLLVAENSLLAIETQHVAIGGTDGADRSVAVVGNGRIEGWLAALQAHGLDPDAILPAPLLLARPEEGYVRAEIGGETVLRGRTTAFADDGVLTPLVVGDAPVAALDGEPEVLRALDDPELDLRQGAFAKRRRFRIDWANVKRLAWTGLAVASVTLLIALVQIARYGFAADRLDAQAEAVARRAAPGGRDPVVALDARLAGLRGGGLGFTATAGALVQAVQATPNVELAGVEFSADGLLRATVFASGAPDVEALRARIRAAGLAVEASPFQSEAGRIRGELRVGGR